MSAEKQITGDPCTILEEQQLECRLASCEACDALDALADSSIVYACC